MKKLIATLALCAGLGCAAFASMEINGSLVVAPVANFNEQASSIGPMEKGVGFAVKPDLNFFFLSFGSVLDIGLNAGGSYGYTKDSFGAWRDGLQLDDPAAVRAISVKVGPAARLNLGRHSFVVTPGVSGNLFTKGESNLFDLAFSCGIGYRLWFINKTYFKLGLNLGADLTWPIEGKGKTGLTSFKDLKYSDLTGTYRGFDADFYAGLSLNLGR